MFCRDIEQRTANRLWRRCVVTRCALILAGLLCSSVILTVCRADLSEQVATTNTFPSVPEVLGGRTFENNTEQDIYFLQAIHDCYASHWSDLLEANITINDFVLAPEKLLRFVNELGDAMQDRNDVAACTNLEAITSDPSFYANSGVSRPEILKAAALALIKIGPKGRNVLAGAFTVSHYCTDSSSIETLADAIGEARPADLGFVKALAATAFDFSTTNGSYYPHCISMAVKNLLCLSGGLSAVQAHLNREEMLNNPGRFQSVVDGIGEAHAVELVANLAAVQPKIEAKLVELPNTPDAYRDDLRGLDERIQRVIESLRKR